jgi:hypothetical protein
LSQVLARVATGVHEIPRGPDVVHRIAVKRSWLERGDVIEFTLPRNLACAACSGGGCDRCGRSGAISLRTRRDPPAVLTVPLPKRSAEEIASEPSVVLRVPEQGGEPEPGSPLPRGLLLLRIEAAAKTDTGVKRVKVASGRASLAPKGISLAPKPAKSELEPLSEQSGVAPKRSAIAYLWLFLALVWIFGLLFFAARHR